MHEEVLRRSKKLPARKGRFRILSPLVVCVSVLLIGAVINAFFFLGRTTPRQSEETSYGEELNPPRTAYDLHLIDQDGKPFRLSQLRGKVVLFSFGYTHCPDVCPTTLSDLAEVYRSLPDTDRNRVQVLFISVDPQRDQPDALKKYLPYFDASFVGLTGSSDQVKETAAAYGAAYSMVHPQGQGPDVYYINHSPFAYLISPNGKWRLRFLFTQLSSTEKVRADIERFLANPNLP
jgi:protein SCO1